MSPVAVISVLVQFYTLIISAIEVHGAEIVGFTLSTPANNNFTLKENDRMCLRASPLDHGPLVPGKCTANCTVNNSVVPIRSCDVHTDEQKQEQFIDVIMGVNMTRTHNGRWVCRFTVIQRTYLSAENYTDASVYPSYVFQLNVLVENVPVVQSWIVITFGVGVLVLLVIIGQTICIIHFKREARVVRRQAEWTSRRASAEDTVRYSKMPVQKIKVDQVPESRESGIYEALENVRVTPAPAPPPLKTLPRKVASHNSSPSPLESPAEATSARSFTNGMLLPFTNSLLRNTNKKSKEPKESKETGPDNKRSTIDRIKERPPMPPPSEELYEVMENSPTPPRKEPKKKEVQKKEAKKNEVEKKEEFRAFNTTKLRKTPAPGKLGSGAQTLQSQVIPSQLKEELKKRVNTVLLEPPRQKEVPLRTAPFNPGLPPAGAPAARPALPTPRPEAGTASPPKSPMVPKFKPLPPIKPKQLHRLPPPPCRPESIHVITADGDDDDEDDEDWTYEPLPNYNIYSI